MVSVQDGPWLLNPPETLDGQRVFLATLRRTGFFPNSRGVLDKLFFCCSLLWFVVNGWHILNRDVWKVPDSKILKKKINKKHRPRVLCSIFHCIQTHVYFYFTSVLSRWPFLQCLCETPDNINRIDIQTLRKPTFTYHGEMTELHSLEFIGYQLHPHTTQRPALYTMKLRASEVCISGKHTVIVAGDKGACNLCSDTTAAGERNSSEITQEQNVPLIKRNKTIKIPPEARPLLPALKPYRWRFHLASGFRGYFKIINKLKAYY